MSVAPDFKVKDPRYPIRPSHIDLSRRLVAIFGRHDTELEAVAVVMACLEAGDRWSAIEPAVLSRHLHRVRRSSENEGGLIEPVWLTQHRYLILERDPMPAFRVTHEFVARCFTFYPMLPPRLD